MILLILVFEHRPVSRCRAPFRGSSSRDAGAAARYTDRMLAGFRILVPAWRFFQRACVLPALELRVGAPGEALGGWAPVIARGRRGLVLAPAANLALAYHGVVERLATELGELELEDDGVAAPDRAPEPEVVALVSYKLVSHLAQVHVPAALRGVPGARFQWKLVDDGADLVVSAELPA